MKATEFVKKYGWDKAKTHLAIMDAENWHNEFFNDLQNLVNAYELVESYGGLKVCHEKLYMLHDLTENPEPIRDAVLLVESCI